VAGLSEREATKTIDSGLKGGAGSPRTVPDRTGSHRIAQERVATAAPTSVLVPGSHQTDEDYVEQGNGKFASQVLDALPPGRLYRRSSVVGELIDGQFVTLEPDRLRAIVDDAVRLCASKTDKETGEVTDAYRPCTRDHAGVLLKHAATHAGTRELRHIYRYPVCVGPDFLPARSGWNAGVYLDCATVPKPLPLDEARAVLDDLVCDFPFAADADRANYFGLLVTVLVRPAIAEPVPFHLIGAPVAGSGKSKLNEIVLGCGLLGRPLPATQIGVREEEREKRITAAMLAGDSVINLDNLREFLDSAALASLLTAAEFRGRELGHSRMIALPNDSTVVGSANNLHTTDEIARRIVPITLQPITESPENRQDYRHPQLRAYVEYQLDRTRAAVLGLVAAWRDAGRPRGGRVVGSFERWSAVVGGIMQTAGYTEWCSNLAGWRGTADDTNAELRELVALWLASHQGWISTSDLFKLVIGSDLFSRQLCQPTERGQQTAFGRVLSAITNRIVSGHRIEVEGRGKRRRARLAPNIDNTRPTEK
jgi:hypothetical protein